MEGFWIVLPCIWLHLCAANVGEGSDDNEGKTEIYFSFITAKSGDSSVEGSIPIIDYALEEINNSTELLQNYTLKYKTVMDSKCKTIDALESFLSQFDNSSYNEPMYLSVMCCGCSVATIPVAEISHHWNIPHISFASSDQLLNNRDRFKTFFRTLPCYVYVPPTIFTMMDEFSWSQLAVITQSQAPFSSVTNDLKSIFKNQSWTLNTESTFDPSSGAINYESLLNWDDGVDYRIIFINTLEIHAYHIICEAYKKYGNRLLEQDIVLILHGRYTQEWWETAHENINSSCSRHDIMSSLNYTLTLTPDTYNLMDDPRRNAISGKTSSEIENVYSKMLSKSSVEYKPLNFYGNAYDAMWSIALGLNLTNQWLQDENITNEKCDQYSGEYVSLAQFNYRNEKMGCLLRESFQMLNFTGITGQVSFKEDGARPENVMRLRQHRVIASQNKNSFSINRPTVAKVINKDTYSFGKVDFNEKGQVDFVNNESYLTIWPYQGGDAPYDGTPVKVIAPTPIGLTVTYYFLGLFGIIAVTICLIFNVVFRKRRIVKLGSPNLNFLIILGALILYVSMFFFTISVFSLEDNFIESVLCNFRIWLFSIGYTLCFAVILAKQWRVYHIFSNPSPNKIIIKDWMLLIIVCIILAIDTLILFIGTAVPDLRLEAKLTVDQRLRKNADGLNEIVYRFNCSNEYATIWIAISFVYKAVLQLGGIFMAFTTRKVTIKALNDVKENCALVYINSIILTILIISQLVLYDHSNVYVSLFGLAVFVQATLFLSVVFIPKAVQLYMNPTGDTIFTETHPAGTGRFTKTKTIDEQTTTIPGIKLKITELQKQLEQLEREQSNE